MIWIRADANGEIGTGHVMRCLSIAHALRQCGQQVRFVAADEGSVPLLEGRGQEYVVLHSDYTRMEDELLGLGRLFREEKPDFFLVDSYFATPDYLREIRGLAPVGILDDTARTGLPVDLLINYNIFADIALYREGDTGTRYLLGTDYVPLREEFVSAACPVRREAKTVLVTTGGSDKYNLAGQLLKKALASPGTADLKYIVVSGAYNEHLPELKELEGRHSSVSVYCNVADMSRLMRESDIAVSAGGSTMYELSAVGVPIVCFSFVDNQERIVRGFVEKGLVPFGGDYLAQGGAMLEEAVSHIERLAADFGLRQGYSERLRRVVDGQGAMRIAREICGL